MIDYPEYTFTLPPPCPTNRDHLNHLFFTNSFHRAISQRSNGG